jgi:hypothetical protein
LHAESLDTQMSTQFCDRYRERNVVNPREMLALRNSKVDLSKWEPVSFGHTPPSKVKTLAAQGFVILEITAKTIARARRWYGHGVQKVF